MIPQVPYRLGLTVPNIERPEQPNHVHSNHAHTNGLLFNKLVATLAFMTSAGEHFANAAAAALGQDGRMPSRLDTPEMPPRAAAAHRAISGNGRLRALRFLLDHPNSTRPEVAEGAAISTAAAQTVLADLEELGYVIADTPEPRNGRTIRYSADRPAITRDLHEFMIWTLS